MAKKEQTYGEAMQELQEIMYRIENEDLDVDILLEEVKKAANLIKFCKDKLQKTNVEIQKILDKIE
ncbi:exodeoxyribonuclease VII small subunit [Dysgonomonas sp. PFB1-18]|jgi:exodeoxyribonuclease VII small subunit|uniref:exodeoxyribonuclease VII small subunit n=1 Tax=unclassified Dysgonomonas TaxID=2630389 RepID=UPI0024743981|nr:MULTISPECIES: exodeoxyribonuclease VII small subunit [unclassified Dysgonomonas]MDH6307378.1 exodeoxyribonuclease VII small subunit [Dysgonomonas sp. PF1-14]MDH6337296.1 exodeoxyribonuclease VII small subunit [Dysgonomonas sp. PF1-16]MDH6379220.1 exodeoxyribonuclease VII small subunit [Dysgonomonas sp. PFB1-18]MDH6396142.1 exodeoxyribonuclease VII small subunit [Dysgonomonas sp. PF1-23]